MAEHVKPTSCTKSGNYDSWILTCTGGTVTKMAGHCEGKYEFDTLTNKCSNSNYGLTTADLRCSLDTIISNGQGMYLNITVSNYYAFNACIYFNYDMSENYYKSTMYNQLDVSTIISKINL
jgi:hypothetical protein